VVKNVSNVVPCYNKTLNYVKYTYFHTEPGSYIVVWKRFFVVVLEVYFFENNMLIILTFMSYEAYTPSCWWKVVTKTYCPQVAGSKDKDIQCLQDYVTGKLEPLLKANVVAGLLTSLILNGYIYTH